MKLQDKFGNPMSETMKLQDGTVFELGMTVVMFNGREITTSPETHRVEAVMFQGFSVDCLYLKDGTCGYGLNLLYPSQEARINHQATLLEELKRQIDEEIQYLREGGEPDSCHFLHLQ